MNQMPNIIETSDLGKKYQSTWALKNCNVSIPKGSISALVGPNGAGKTTLLKILTGLSERTEGAASVLGQIPSQDGSYISQIGYLAQEIPLYENMTVADHLELGMRMNNQWDVHLAQTRLGQLGIIMQQKVGKLSGGQRAQVGLAMALAKKPKLLILDEPVAALDPLAREDFLIALTSAVQEAQGGLSVLMSSHLLGDLERICDHIIILTKGSTQFCGSIDDLLDQHKLLIGGAKAIMEKSNVDTIEEIRTPRQTTLLVNLRGAHFNDSNWQIQNPTAEEIALAYMKRARGNTSVQKGKK